jgi:cytosine/adenosine deaminase-related metal-dependent hydrolase
MKARPRHEDAPRVLERACRVHVVVAGGLDAGELVPGGRADLVAVDLTAPALRGARVLPALVFAGHPGLVTDVWVRGRRIVEDSRHPHEATIVAAAEQALARADAA